MIIFIAVLLIVSTAIVFVESSTDNMNKSMQSISDCIVQADSDYNEAVDLVNGKNFYDGMEKAVSAGDNFNRSLRMLNEMRDSHSDINAVHKEYIDTVITEINFKLQAVDLLKQAIECFEIQSNYTGTQYAYQANDLMIQAGEFQNQRDLIVEDNSELFK